jgi:predicted small lipoprotein YifL
MRILLLIALTAAAAGCGQTGSLYLPDKGVETPVEIHGPADQDKEKEKKDDKATQPPGR